MKTINIKKSRLQGKVIVSGAKNSALKLLTASLLTDDIIELYGFPNGLLDVNINIGGADYTLWRRSCSASGWL